MPMLFCSKCGSAVSEKSKFCGSCGNPQEPQNVPEERASEPDTTLISPQSSDFLKTYLKVTAITVVILAVIFWMVGSYEEDSGDAIIGTVIMAGLLGLLVTFAVRGKPKGTQVSDTKKKASFFGGEQLLASDTEEVKVVKQGWNNFTKIFWCIFLLKIVSKGGGSVDDEDIVAILALFELVAIGAMVITMGYYAYKFSGKKSYWLFGLLGFLWFAIIGIFLGYWQVQRIRDERLGRKGETKSFQLSK